MTRNTSITPWQSELDYSSSTLHSSPLQSKKKEIVRQLSYPSLPFRLGDELFSGSEVFEVAECHIWFNKAVARWLDIALYKAMQRIIKVLHLNTRSILEIISLICYIANRCNSSNYRGDSLSKKDNNLFLIFRKVQNDFYIYVFLWKYTWNVTYFNAQDF